MEENKRLSNALFYVVVLNIHVFSLLLTGINKSSPNAAPNCYVLKSHWHNGGRLFRIGRNPMLLHTKSLHSPLIVPIILKLESTGLPDIQLYFNTIL